MQSREFISLLARSAAQFRRTLAILAAVAALSALASDSLASIAVDIGDFSGSRQTVGNGPSGGGLVWNPVGGSWSNGGFELEWTITDNGSDFTYEYTLNTPSGGQAGLSHWIIELSTIDALGNSLQSHWESIFSPDDEVKTHNSGQGNPGLPASDVYGFRFEPNLADGVFTSTYTFTTPQIPVWGDFYAKDGGGTGTSAVYAYNIGFGTDPADGATDFTNWIPRPDGIITPPPPGGGEAPEPMSLIVWSLLIGGAIYSTARRQRTP